MDDEHKVGDDTSVEETVADTSNGNTSSDTASADDPAKLKEYAQNQKVRAEKAERELKELKQKGTKETTTSTTVNSDDIRKQTEATVKATLEQRDLDEMEYSDEIKAEIKRVAQVQNVSVRKAAQDPYIQHRIAQANATNRNNEAGVTRTQKSTTVQSAKIPKFDLSTADGRKEYDAWKQSKKGE